jgi:hypothetical protein
VPKIANFSGYTIVGVPRSFGVVFTTRF